MFHHLEHDTNNLGISKQETDISRDEQHVNIDLAAADIHLNGDSSSSPDKSLNDESYNMVAAAGGVLNERFKITSVAEEDELDETESHASQSKKKRPRKKSTNLSKPSVGNLKADSSKNSLERSKSSK